MTQEQIDLQRKMRYKARTDLLWLCNNVLDYRKIRKEVHGPIINKLQQFPLPSKFEMEKLDVFKANKWSYTPVKPLEDLMTGSRVLILDPRSWFKTTINCIAHTVQWIINYPDISILIVQSTGDKADLFLSEVKQHFQMNPRFRDLFPEMVPQRRVMDWGTKSEFTTPGRTPGKIKREPTVMATAIDKGVAGIHVDVIKFSDIVEQKNSVTKEQLHKVAQQFGMFRNILVKPSCWIDVEGTRYDFSDLYGRIIDGEEAMGKKGLPKQWRIHVRGCYQKDLPAGQEPLFTPEELRFPDKRDENGLPISLFPQEWPVDALEAMRRDPSVDEFLFAAQQKNNPVDLSDPSRIPFAVSKMRIKSREEFKEMRVAYHTTTVDTADTQNAKSKFSVITTCAWDKFGRCYVHDIRHGKFLPDDIVEHICDVQIKYRPMHILIEETAFVRGLMPALYRPIQLGYFTQRKAPEPFFKFTKRENDVSKDERILLTLQPWYKRGDIFFLEDLACMDELRRELSQFPSYIYKDIMDTLADQFQDKEWFGREDAMGIPAEEVRQLAFERALGIADPYDPASGYWVPTPSNDEWYDQTGGL